MIYTCQHCGAWFTSEEINKASKNRDAVITCSFCNMANEFLNPNASRLTRAYNALEEGRFEDAINVLTLEIGESQKHFRTPSPDAFLGLALARFGIRTIFDSNDAKRMGNPDLVFWDYHREYLADDDNFLRAKNSFGQFNSSADFRESESSRQDVQTSDNIREREKLEKIADYVDSIKDYYDEIRDSKKKDFQYGTFIAFEDDDAQAGSWELVATKVKNELPKMPVFIPPDKSFCDSNLQYEARMMYALHHSKCMVVLIGDNPSTRLRGMYTWYYHHGNQTKGANLGFIHHNSHITIRLADKEVNKRNLFDTKEPEGYKYFIKRWNGIIDVFEEDKKDQEKEKDKEKGKTILVDPPVTPKTDVALYKIVDDHHLTFGHYPQTRETSLAVTKHFQQFERPDKTDDRGWIVLFKNRKGEAYTWYRDAEIDGERYRAVYFTQFREKCVVRPSDKGTLQSHHGYKLRIVYCFKFEPIVWDVEKIDPKSSIAVLVSEKGMESRAYNNLAMDNDWNDCSVHSWLTHDFYDNAFEDGEKNVLCRYEGASEEKVFLIDKDKDSLFIDRHHNIAVSDYYKCLGGMGDNCLDRCWVTDKSLAHNAEASVMQHPAPTASGKAARYALDRMAVDVTSVAVMPKVVLALKIGDEKSFKI